MRKNTQAIMNAWHQGRPKGTAGAAVWTDGVTVYSYGTAVLAPLAEEEPGCAPYVVNATKYSTTTSGHVNAIRRDVPARGLVLVHDMEKGATAQDLIRRGLEVQAEREAEAAEAGK